MIKQSKNVHQNRRNRRYTQRSVRKQWIRGDTKNHQTKWSINEKEPASAKIQKFNNFWYKPKAQIKATTTEETENTEALTYAEKFFQETEHNNQLTKQ